jgi:hypothetical protein
MMMIATTGGWEEEKEGFQSNKENNLSNQYKKNYNILYAFKKKGWGFHLKVVHRKRDRKRE